MKTLKRKRRTLASARGGRRNLFARHRCTLNRGRRFKGLGRPWLVCVYVPFNRRSHLRTDGDACDANNGENIIL